MQQSDLDFTARPVYAPYQRGSDTSKAAAIRAERFIAPQGRKVYAWIVQRGERGGTQKECEMELHITRQSLCGRFRALEQTSRILKTGERRAGCVVYRSMKESR